MLRSLAAVVLRLLRAMARGLGGLLLRWGEASRHDRSEPPPEQTTDGVADGFTDDSGDSTADPAEEARRSPAELVTTLISLLLIFVLAGAILYDGYAGGASVPAHVDVTVDVAAAARVADGFHVPFEVRNTGDRTIEEVLLTFTVSDGGAIVEETETVIALLGERGTASGVLVLHQDPAGLEIEAGVSTFQTAEE